MLKCWWLMGCGMLIVGGAGLAGTVADQGLGKGWDDGMTVGRERDQTPDTGFIPNSQNQSENPPSLPTAQMVKTHIYIHPIPFYHLV